MRVTQLEQALEHLGQGNETKEVRNNLSVELVNAQKASEPQPLANDIEGKAAFVARKARLLNELEADIATASVSLLQRRRNLQVDITELEFMRQELTNGAVNIEKQEFPCLDMRERQELHLSRELAKRSQAAMVETIPEHLDRTRKLTDELRWVQDLIASKRQQTDMADPG